MTQSKIKKLQKAKVHKDACVACGLCVKHCPKNAIHIAKGLYAIIDEARCVGCGKCGAVCPASVIDICEVAP